MISLLKHRLAYNMANILFLLSIANTGFAAGLVSPLPCVNLQINTAEFLGTDQAQNFMKNLKLMMIKPEFFGSADVYGDSNTMASLLLYTVGSSSTISPASAELFVLLTQEWQSQAEIEQMLNGWADRHKLGKEFILENTTKELFKGDFFCHWTKWLYSNIKLSVVDCRTKISHFGLA